MNYEVVVAPKHIEKTVTIDAASPQLAAQRVCLMTSSEFEVLTVNGIECLGRCVRCDRHVFMADRYMPSTREDGPLCGLCVKETESEAK